jgi:DMSO/TMAO reductase YedYZ molybdopterin-dependent catalytic subunit
MLPDPYLSRALHREQDLVADLGDVRERGAVGGFGVVRLHGGQDRFVAPQTRLRAIGNVQVALPRLAQQVQDDVVQAQQDVVIRRPRQRVVECSVLVHERLPIQDAVPLPLEQAFELADVLSGRPRGRQPRDAWFDELAHFEDFRKFALTAQNRRRQRRDERLGVSSADERSAALTALDDSLHLQSPQRFSNRRAADAESLRELTLRRDLVAWRPAPLTNEGVNLLDDVLVDSTALYRFEEHIWSICRRQCEPSLGMRHKHNAGALDCLTAMAFNFFRRQLNERERAVADRLPPGQYLTEKWPVLHYGGVPKVDLATWQFTIEGLVEKPATLTYAQFKELPRRTVKADVHCVTRWSMLDSTWEGVPIAEVMKLVQLKPDATHVMVHAEAGFTANLSLEDFLREENMLVDTRNGEPITPEHGWPLRLFVPHLYFWKSAKWVRGLEFMHGDRPGFWEQYGYHMRGDPWAEERYGWQ